MAASRSIDRQDPGDAASADLSAAGKWALAGLAMLGGIAALAARSIPDQVARVAFGVSLAVLLFGVTMLAKRSSRMSGYWQLSFVLFVFAFVQVLNNSIPSFLLTNILNEQSSSGDPLASSVFGTVVIQLVEALIAVAAILVLVRMAGLDLGSIYARRGRFGSAYLIAIVAFVALYLIIGLSPAAHRYLPIQGSMDPGRYLALTPALLIMVISNGFEEEFLFRGLFLQRYTAFFGPWVANVMQAFVFAFAHIGITYTPNALFFILVAVFPLGLVAGQLMRRSDGVVAPAIFHAAVDIPIYLAFLTFAS